MDVNRAFEAQNSLPLIFFYLIITPLGLIYHYLIFEKLKIIKGKFQFAPAKKSKVVLTLIGLFGALIVPLTTGLIIWFAINPLRQLKSNQDSIGKNYQNRIQTYLDRYQFDYGTYPESLEQLVPDYTDEIPTDPKTDLPYQYTRLGNGQDYLLCTRLENGLDECVKPESVFPPAIFPKTDLTPTPTGTKKSPPVSGCKIGGCNSEVCSDTDSGEIMSVCLYKPEYACYKFAVCEIQENGQCGWTITEATQTCLDNLDNPIPTNTPE